MKHENFNMKEHGFVGHLAEPDEESEKAVIVIMGGEQSLLPGIKFAERFADYGITGLAVSLFGAEGLPEGINEVPLDMFVPAVLVAQYIGGMENLIMVSPTHVPFEGTMPDKKTMTGKSIVTFHGEEIPFVHTDFASVKLSKYYKHPDVSHRVTGMWIAYYNTYQDKAAERAAWLHLEKSNARILLIAGAADEAWPAEYSVNALKKYLDDLSYEKDVKVIVYPHGSHLNGLMPNRQREKRLYRMLLLTGLMYKTFGKCRKEKYFDNTEREVIDWIVNS